MRSMIKSRREAGFLLGPVFYEFCCRLCWCTAQEAPATDALLFMARGGLRLQYLFELFLKINRMEFGIPCFPFWSSRFFGVKMTFQENPELAVGNLVREFACADCAAVANALLPEELYPDKEALLRTLPEDIASAPVTREKVFALYQSRCDCSVKLREHLREQHDLGHRLLNERFGSFRNLHIVDSGWFGSTLGSLQTGCPRWHWDALYFGRWNYRGETPWYFGDVTGLMIDAVGLKGKNAIDIFLEYHHILEAVLEPELPSVEYCRGDGSCNAMIPGWEGRIAGDDTEELWSGVKDYFASAPPADLDACTRATSRVLKKWKRLLRYPTRDEARILEVPPRSADFGKNRSTAVFDLSPVSGIRERWRQVRCSLWPAGEIAVTFRRGVRLKQLFWHVGKRFLHYRGAV